MKRLLTSLGVVFLIACGDFESPVQPDWDGFAAAQAILDGSRLGGNSDFRWLPPMVKGSGDLESAFDPTLLDDLRVEICEFDGELCVGDLVATFDSESGDTCSSRLRLSGGEVGDSCSAASNFAGLVAPADANAFRGAVATGRKSGKSSAKKRSGKSGKSSKKKGSGKSGKSEKSGGGHVEEAVNKSAVDEEEETPHYHVNWRTSRDMDPDIDLRIRVMVGDVELGYADVDLVRRGKDLRQVDDAHFVGVRLGQTVAIKFLVGEGAVPGNVKPVAAMTIAETITAGVETTFDGATSSATGDRTIAEYRWDFGDGQTTTTAGPEVAHTYASEGDFTASLVVVDSEGDASDAFVIDLTVEAPVPPPTDAILHYAFNSSGNTAIDETGNYDGLIAGGVNFTLDRVDVDNAAIQFDGVDDRVTVADADPLDLTSSFSVVFWARLAEFDGRTNVMISKHDTGITGDGSWSFGVDASGLPTFEAFGATGVAVQGSTALSPLQWRQVVFTYDADNQAWSFYFDGVADGSGSTDLQIANTDLDLKVGKEINGGSTRSFKGDADDLRIWTRALEAGEVAALYASESPAADDVFDGFVESNGQWYALTGAARSWQGGQALADHFGGDLVTIDAEAENGFLVTQFLASSPYLWIGLNDLVLEGTFEWADGSALAFTKWKSGEPNDFGSGEDCVVILRDGNGEWNDGGCPALVKGIVEFVSDPR